MITQKQIDDYNYMLKASKGIILIKPEEDIYQQVINNNYRELEDVLYNIDDICDNCNLIGIGLNPYTKELFNHSAINYPFLDNILQKIRIFHQEPIVITANIDDLTLNNLLILNKYNNINLVINLYNSFIINNKFNFSYLKEQLEYLKQYINIIPSIDCFYIPYFKEYKFDQMFLSNLNTLKPKGYYYYACNDTKENYLYFINHLNAINKIPIHIVEELGNEIDIKIINILNNVSTEFEIGDILLGINNQYFNFKDDFYNFILNTEDEEYEFSVWKKGEIQNIKCKKDLFLNNIILNNDIRNICNELYPELFYNECSSLILYPDYNIDILNKKIKKSYSANTYIEPIVTNYYFNYKNINLEDCRAALNNFRQNNPDKLITTLYIPQEIIQNILRKNKDISLEQFQRETLTIIYQI